MLLNLNFGMKKYFFQKPNENMNITEIFGLPKSGKSTFIEKLKKEKMPVIGFKSKPSIIKLFYFFKYALKRPCSTMLLFYTMNKNKADFNLSFADSIKIFLMRNSYLSAVLAKQEFLSNAENAYVEEFSMQSLFMLFHSKASRKQIEEAMALLPLPSRIILLEEKRSIRYNRWNKIKNPARNINIGYRMKWWANMEKNYPIIKRIISEGYFKAKFSRHK